MRHASRDQRDFSLDRVDDKLFSRMKHSKDDHRLMSNKYYEQDGPEPHSMSRANSVARSKIHSGHKIRDEEYMQRKSHDFMTKESQQMSRYRS